MKIKLSKCEVGKGEQKLFEGEYSYSESSKLDGVYSISLTIITETSNTGEVFFEFKDTKEIDNLIEQLNILKYKRGKI